MGYRSFIFVFQGGLQCHQDRHHGTQDHNNNTHQQALLSALNPYLTRDRISRLERAMRAAKLAGMATAFLGGGGHV